MTNTPLDVVAIGNAIVDVLAHADDEFLIKNDLMALKGTMRLIDEDEAEKLYGLMGSAVECSGGSAANTVAGIASLGGASAFIGKVKDDGLGKVFSHDIRNIGVEFTTSQAIEGPATARSMILVTPDAERTMNTFLGIAPMVTADDVDEDMIKRAQVTYLEGYLWDQPAAKDAIRKAIDLAHEAGREVAFSLSDPFCVDRHRAEFRQLVEEGVDILFANEDEIKSLYEKDTFDAALQELVGKVDVAALTRGSKGAVIIWGDRVHVVDVDPVDSVVDTTGAGDLYAAGFLFGYTKGKDAYECGRLGGIAAGEIISHYGARPETPLNELV